MAKALQVSSIGPFDVQGDQTSLAQRWSKWKKSFEYYLLASGVTDKAQKRALLLHTVGSEVQEIFDTLEETGEDITTALRKLDEHFQGTKNVAFERHVFRSEKQRSDETIESFVIRLKKFSDTCEFGGDRDDHIRDQIIEKCYSAKLRKRLLREKDLTLAKVMDVARTNELVDLQADRFETSSPKFVNTVATRVYKEKEPPKPQHDSDSKRITCFKCGYEGHKAAQCRIVEGKKCNKCGKPGHFSKVCKTGRRGNENTKVNSVQLKEENGESSDEYAFVLDNNHDGMLRMSIDGVEIDMLIDSGASCNVINDEIYERMLKGRENVKTMKVSKKLYAYGSDRALNIRETFKTDVQFENTKQNAEFMVVEGNHTPLLGKKTATQLGVLRVGPDASVYTVEHGLDGVIRKYEDCFKGVGKLKDFQLKIHVDPNVDPVIQRVRRVPFSLRSALERKLDELEKLDIIEKVTQPSSWVSPLVIVPKKNGEIRVCVDMRRANEAIQRERHPIPTVDEVLEEMNGSALFSKLDLRWGYHQIELDKESREVTTFITHKGMYRYKRLMFGVSSAPEIYQRVISQVIQGCEGARNLSDDIVVYGKDQADHDAKLEVVLQRIRENGLTLNKEKCKFGMPKITFLGHTLSARGISPDQSKVEAVVNTRTPRNSAEIKSFLGLANYCARFIPDFSTISAPLRELTRSNVNWHWGQVQENAFQELKSRLASKETLAYFNPKCETRVIVDASPVGLGAILSQKQPDGEYRPVAYASRALTDVETRYSQTEREALGVVFGCERFHLYLLGIEFEMITDHKPLEVIYSPKSKPPARIERWALRLQPYNFKVTYQPGPTNAADSLSRLSQTGTKECERNVAEEYAYFVTKSATPIALTIEEIDKESSEDEEVNAVRNALKSENWKDCNQTYKFVKNELSQYGNILLRGTKIVVPKQLREEVLKAAHEGHQGIVKTKIRLRSKVWWPGIDKDAETICKSCYACQCVSQPTKPEPVIRTELPSAPWHHIAIDLCGPFPQGENLLVLVDYYWVEVAILKTTVSSKIIQCLRNWFSSHGLPEKLSTDNGPQFVSSEFKEFLEENGIEHRRTTPYWPQANGEIERQNRTLLKAIKTAYIEGKNWREEITTFLLAYRSTPHTVTGVSPAELLYGRKIRTKIPDLQNMRIEKTDGEVRDRDNIQKSKGKEYTDNRRQASQSNLNVGDRVLIQQSRQNKLSPNFNAEPQVVVERKGNSVTTENAEGVSIRRNVSHVKKFVELAETEEDKQTEPNAESQQRVHREAQRPKYLEDYVCAIKALTHVMELELIS